MASLGNVETLLAGIRDPEVQLSLKGIFRYLLSNLSLGRATSGSSQSATSTTAPSENFSGGFFQGKTSAVANHEFVIGHSFGRSPYLLIPVLPLDQVSAAIVRLTVSRAADASYVYLKSPDTSQPVFVYLEG